MASRNSSSAYDFSMFEPKKKGQERPAPKQNVIEIPQKRLEENRRPKHRARRVVPTLLAFVVVAGLVSSYVYGQVQLTELTESLNGVTKTLSEQQNTYTQLQMKSDSQLSLDTVENYAAQKLGMKKVDQSQVASVELSKGDKAQVLVKEQSSNWVAKVWSAIRGFLS